MAMADHTTTTNGYSEEKPSGGVQHKSNDHTTTTTTTTTTNGCSEEKPSGGVQHKSNDHTTTTTTTNGCSEEKSSGGVQLKSNDHTTTTTTNGCSEEKSSGGVPQKSNDHTTTTNGCLAEKWSGGVHLVLDCPVEAAWAIQSDFLGLTRWVPTISICRCEEGENKKPGCLRYCKGTGTTYVYERLLEFDDAHKYMSYRMEKNHFVFRDGFQGYVAKVKLSDVGKGKKTLVDWTYEVDPVATQTHKQLTEFMIQFYTVNLKYLETAAQKATTTTVPIATYPLESRM